MDSVQTMELDPQNGNKQLFNNQRLSDVRFLVDGQILYCHKVVLALGSPVFESMFFGQMKEQRDVFEIDDLTLIGFKNALRYIYGFPIDFKFSQLYESYMAADKYLLRGFNETFVRYIMGMLDTKNSCLIYDQLIKIGEREQVSLDCLRTTIITNSKWAFESEYFTQIDQETLISLLSLDELSINEFDLLAAVLRWVDCEVRRQGFPVTDESRRRVFEPIKGYVLFGALTSEEIADSKAVVRLLTEEEKGSLALFLGKNMPLKVKLMTSRKAFSGISRTAYLSFKKRTIIGSVHTTYSGSADNLSIKIRGPNGVDLDLKPERRLYNGMWNFDFLEPDFIAEPHCLYELVITGDEQLTKEDQMSKWSEIKFNTGEVCVEISTKPALYGYSSPHIIKGLCFKQI